MSIRQRNDYLTDSRGGINVQLCALAKLVKSEFGFGANTVRILENSRSCKFVACP